MKSSHIWETCQRLGKTKKLKIFNRNDRAWSGWISWSDAFVQALTFMIESEIDSSIDLTKEYRKKIMTGKLDKVMLSATLKQLNIYPGYPKLI
tara:strand:- start:61 stop:339 length:279 start_codon:yes stop_codon:yes gene_type:complete